MPLEARLDPLGGIAGDMLVAAMVDAFPELAPSLDAVLAALPLPAGVAARIEPFHDGTQGGKRLVLDLPHEHAHRSWLDIRHLLKASALEPAVRDRAIAIFALLAEAEAAVHGVPVDEVHFHEVGALDSIVDIVLAAHLIQASGVTRWTVAPLPLGSGRIKTQHGLIAIPAPATSRLIEGFATVDDGIEGERVTPTGAAILRHLAPEGRAAGRLVRQGQGFGTRRMPGISNLLRILVLETDGAATGTAETIPDTILEIAFEIDDQTGEDLALGLDRLRWLEGVRDVLQIPAFGKKGRMVTAVRLLADPAARQRVVEACFLETTTLGLRLATVERAVLQRQAKGEVKLASRPGGIVTAKLESDAVKPGPAHERDHHRALRVARALKDEPDA